LVVNHLFQTLLDSFLAVKWAERKAAPAAEGGSGS